MLPCSFFNLRRTESDFDLNVHVFMIKDQCINEIFLMLKIEITLISTRNQDKLDKILIDVPKNIVFLRDSIRFSAI